MGVLQRETVQAGTTAGLASFLAQVHFDDLPRTVVDRTEDLLLDWAASALAGRNSRPVQTLHRFVDLMGPTHGPSEILVSRRRTSPLFAALVNGAASHVVEQDDVHNAAVFHPGTVVFAAALATAQQRHASGRDLITAAVVGYEAGIRIGAFLGRSHYRVFHTTGTAGTLAAAAATAHLLGADDRIMLHALGSAGTQAAGLWEFLRDAADSKQLHTAKAAADGLLAAYIACDGFTGATQILEGSAGMAAGMSTDADVGKLTDNLGDRWAIMDTSFKWHASCRHTHPAADALLQAMREHDLSAEGIVHVRAHVHQPAIDVLGTVTDPQTVHQSKFSVNFVLALIAHLHRAGITDFSDETLQDSKIRTFMSRVEMVMDPEIDHAYPTQWIGLVEVDTADGRHIVSRVDIPKGDPENTLSRAEIVDKVHRLAAFGAATSTQEVDRLIEFVWALDQEPHVGSLLPSE